MGLVVALAQVAKRESKNALAEDSVVNFIERPDGIKRPTGGLDTNEAFFWPTAECRSVDACHRYRSCSMTLDLVTGQDAKGTLDSLDNAGAYDEFLPTPSSPAAAAATHRRPARMASRRRNSTLSRSRGRPRRWGRRGREEKERLCLCEDTWGQVGGGQVGVEKGMDLFDLLHKRGGRNYQSAICKGFDLLSGP